MLSNIGWFFWDCWIWVKIRLWPDRRPSGVILAEVRERLEQMPAGKGIHAALKHIEAVEKAEKKP